MAKIKTATAKVTADRNSRAEETETLRGILLSCGLSEEKKWGKPCFISGSANIAVIQSFKEYFALLFLKGMLLDDPKKILVKTGENTRVGRQIRFSNVKEILKLTGAIKGFVTQAVKLEQAGVKPPKAMNESTAMPAELTEKLAKAPAFKKAFEKLTPGRQRGYIFHFSSPKQAATRTSRIEKQVGNIMAGKGFNDR